MGWIKSNLLWYLFKQRFNDDIQRVNRVTQQWLTRRTAPPGQRIFRMGPDSQLRPCGPTRHWTWPGGCSGSVWPRGVVTARPWGRAGGSSGTPAAPLPLSGTSCRSPETPTGCWSRPPSFSSREPSDVSGRRHTRLHAGRHARTHTHFGHMVNGFRSRSACVEKNADMQNFTGLVVVCTFDAFCTFYILLRLLCQCLCNQPLSRTQIWFRLFPSLHVHCIQNIYFLSVKSHSVSADMSD